MTKVDPGHCPFCRRDMTPERFTEEELCYVRERLDPLVKQGWNVGCLVCEWWGDILYYDEETR